MSEPYATGMAPANHCLITFAHNYIRIILAWNVWEAWLASSTMRPAPLPTLLPTDSARRGTLHAPRFLRIRLRHESRDKKVIHISKTAFQRNVILKRRITMWALWGSRKSHVVNDPPLSRWEATYWYAAIEVNFFPNFKLWTTHSYLIIF